MIGLIVGITRFAWEYAYSVPPCGEEQNDPRPSIIKDVHYLHFGIILFAICIIVTVVVSLFTAPIDDKHVSIQSNRVNWKPWGLEILFRSIKSSNYRDVDIRIYSPLPYLMIIIKFF